MSEQYLRVAIVALNYWPEPTGIGPVAADLAVGLDERGHDVTVTAGVPHYPQWRRYDDADERQQWGPTPKIALRRVAHPIPRHPSLVKRTLMELTFGIRAAVRKRPDADVVVLVSPPLLATAVLLARERLRRVKVPMVIWAQDLYGLGVAETAGADSRAAKLALRVESATFRMAGSVAAIHERFADHVVDDLAVRRDRVAVFRNWTRQEPIPRVARDAAVSELGWQSMADGIIVLHAGSMGDKQGLGNVVRAAQLADGRAEKVTFVLLGDGKQRHRLEQLAQGVRSVRFVDVLDADRFGLALRAADILLVNQQPGISDMCVPSKLVSYYSAGRPIVAAVDTAGITAQEVRQSAAGVVVAAGRPDELLDTVVRLGADPARRAALGEAGRAFIGAHFARDSTIDDFSRWLCQIAVARERVGRVSRQ